MTTLAGVPTAAAARQLFSRDHLVQLARAGRHWQSIPLALQALRSDPGDHGLRFLLAAALAKLGLRTPALEQIAKLPAEVRRDPGVAGLAAAAAALPDERITVSERVANCRANVAALVEGHALGGALAAWEERAASSPEVWLRASDGNIVVQSEPGSESFRHLLDFVGQVESLRLPHESTGTVNIKPYVIESADPPWLLRRVLRATPDQPDSYRVRVSLVQRSAMELLDGLSFIDMHAELATDRLRLFIGDDATAQLERDLSSRMDTIIHGHFLGVPPRGAESGGAGRCELPPEQVLHRVTNAQQAECIRLEAAVRIEYGSRDAVWHQRRFSADSRADRGAEQPLRVLIPTCRYSTYIKHAAADLVVAFEASGCCARTLIEPDDCSQFSSPAYLRAIAEFKPDLVVFINYTRSNIGAVIPAGVPVVTWVQDAMPHLFDQRTGESMGPLDFVVGHTHMELYDRFGYPAKNRLKLPVTASAVKFHAAPVGGSLAARLACDVAFITHHSETPERMHARLCTEAAHNPAVVRVFEELRPRIASIIERSGEVPVQPLIREAGLQVAGAVTGREVDDKTAAMLINQYAFPMADRMIRHRVLGWAADACDRRGWTMRLFGRGWQKHERFGPMAAPELAHGDELRAAYQCAAATVHASIHWMYHQRVMECALSGGLPLVFLKADDVSLLRAYAITRMVASAGGWEKVAVPLAAADCAEATSLVAQLQRLGRPVHPAWAALTLDRAAWDRARRVWEGMPAEPGAAFLLGDLAETTFSTPEQFERLIERAVQRGERRENISRGIAARVREHFSTERAAADIIGLVRASLA